MEDQSAKLCANPQYIETAILFPQFDTNEDRRCFLNSEEMQENQADEPLQVGGRAESGPNNVQDVADQDPEVGPRKAQAHQVEEVDCQPSCRTGPQRSRASSELEDDPGNPDPHRSQDPKSHQVLDLPNQVTALPPKEARARHAPQKAAAAVLQHAAELRPRVLVRLLSTQQANSF